MLENKESKLHEFLFRWGIIYDYIKVSKFVFSGCVSQKNDFITEGAVIKVSKKPSKLGKNTP